MSAWQSFSFVWTGVVGAMIVLSFVIFVYMV